MPIHPNSLRNLRKGGGRPALGKSIAEYIRSLGGEDGRVYADKLHEMAVLPHDNPMIRLKAIELLTKRGWPEALDVNLTGEMNAITTVIHEHCSSHA